jgi:hypothetical protein
VRKIKNQKAKGKNEETACSPLSLLVSYFYLLPFAF